MALAATPVTAQERDDTVVVFNGEGNRLNAYDVATGEKQTVIFSAADVAAGKAERGRDINAQICFDPSDPHGGPYHFIAGEDTGQVKAGEERGKQGWGYFQLTGRAVGEFGWEQLGKLEPTYVTDADNPENYGCGFLSDGRLVLADVGDQFPQDPATGQLHIWFPPFDRGFDPVTGKEVAVPYCKIDVQIPTAGQIHVDAQDNVYIGAQRPDTRGNPVDRPNGIYRYSGEWPTSADAAGGCGRTDETGAPLVDEGRITRETFILGGPAVAIPPTGTSSAPNLLASPTGIVPTPHGGYYASSVFDGRINEYDAEGTFVRNILQPTPAEQVQGPPYPSTGTPLGIGVGPDGTIYYADIGVVVKFDPTDPANTGAGPGDQNGSVRAISFDADGNPLPPVKLDDELAFPDGIGILVLPAAVAPMPAPTPPVPTPATLPTTGGGLGVLGLLAIAGAAVLRRRNR